VYSKKEVVENYEELEMFMYRKEEVKENLFVLNKYIKDLLSYFEKIIIEKWKGTNLNIFVYQDEDEKELIPIFENSCGMVVHVKSGEEVCCYYPPNIKNCYGVDFIYSFCFDNIYYFYNIIMVYFYFFKIKKDVFFLIIIYDRTK
jgi:hypothetical protein